MQFCFRCGKTRCLLYRTFRKNMQASPILTVHGSDAKWCFANGTASNMTQGVGRRGSQINQGYFAFRAEETATAMKKRHRLKLQENLELGSEYTIGMWIHFPLAPKPLKKQPNTGPFKDTWQALEKHSWHVAIFSDGGHDSDTELLDGQHPLSFLTRESVGMAAVVHDNTWADVGFVVNYERVDDHVGPYCPKDVTDGWHHFTIVARRGTAAGPKGTSTLFVDGFVVARANAAAMCPLRSLGGHPNTQKGEITQDVGAIAGIEVYCNTALDSDAVNALFRDSLRPIAIAMDKEEGVTTHADGQLYDTDGFIFGAPTRVVRPRAAVPQPPVPREAPPHGFLRKQPAKSKTRVGSGSAVDDDDEEDHMANPSVLASQSGKAKRGPEAGGADDAIGLKDNPKRSKLQGPGGVAAGALNAAAVDAFAETEVDAADDDAADKVEEADEDDAAGSPFSGPTGSDDALEAAAMEVTAKKMAHDETAKELRKRSEARMQSIAAARRKVADSEAASQQAEAARQQAEAKAKADSQVLADLLADDCGVGELDARLKQLKTEKDIALAKMKAALSNPL